MTIIKVNNIVKYIKKFINNKEISNYKSFDYFEYDNLMTIMSNLLNGKYDKENNIIIINNYNVHIQNDNNMKLIIMIVDNELIEPSGPI